MTYEEAIKEFEPFIDHEAYTDSFQEACRMAIEALEKVADLEKRGFTDEVLDNYKTFEDECIAKGFTLKSLIKAREKQTPKGKWILNEENIGDSGNDEYKCPHCGGFDVHHKEVNVPYCWKCGQRLG